jgi:hypothetical protein
MTRLMGWISTLSLVAMSAAAEPVNYQGLWWAAPAESETGWRLKLTQQGRDISTSWTTRNANDHPLWTYSVTAAQTGPNTFTGTLYRERGVRTSAAPDGKVPDEGALRPVRRRQRELLGRATFVFTDDKIGSLAYHEVSYQLSRLPDTDHP